jgi:hypothetical protein
VFDFSDPKEKLAAAGLHLGGPADRIMTTDRGLHLLVKESTGGNSWPRIHLREPFAEDFVVTLDFENLSMIPPQTGWGCVFVLRATFDSTPDLYVDTGIGRYREPTGSVNSVRKHKAVSGAGRHDGRYKPAPHSSGQLRLVRTGNLISSYFAVGDSNEFQLWETWPVGDAPVKTIGVEAASSDAAAVIDLVVTRMTLQTRPPQDSVSEAR